MLYLSRAPYESLDMATLGTLLEWFESRDDELLAKALAFVDDRPLYRRVAERRYLRFIQARARKTFATLGLLNEVAPTDGELRRMLSQDVAWLGIDEGGDPDAFSLWVDLAGSVVASCFDFGAYVDMVSAQRRATGEVDHETTVERHLADLLTEEAAVYRNGWFGQALTKLTHMRLQRVVFNHADGRALRDAMFLDEFIVYANTYMADDVLLWDFFQSEPMRLTEAIYVGTHTNRVRSQDSDVAIVPPLPPFPHAGVFTGPDYAATRIAS